MAEKGVPKRDGSGKGTRDNRGRGGCTTPTDKNKKQGIASRRGNKMVPNKY